jgi:hypothetical protein
MIYFLPKMPLNATYYQFISFFAVGIDPTFFIKLNGLSFDCKVLQGYLLYEVEGIDNEMSCKTD